MPAGKTTTGQLTLCNLATGQGGLVRSLLGGHAFCSRVANLGFTDGAEVRIVHNYGRGPVIVSVRGTRVALGRTEADLVLVDPLDARPAAQASRPG